MKCFWLTDRSEWGVWFQLEKDPVSSLVLFLVYPCSNAEDKVKKPSQPRPSHHSANILFQSHFLPLTYNVRASAKHIKFVY